MLVLLFSDRTVTHPDIQNMQLQSDVGLILGEDFDAVDMAEVGQ